MKLLAELMLKFFGNIGFIIVIWGVFNCVPPCGHCEYRNLSGFMATECRFFAQEAAFVNQRDGLQGSLVIKPEIDFQSDDGRYQFKIAPFYRLDSMDNERTHFDLREGYLAYSSGEIEALVGVNVVFWGVTESQHLVDIINQVDVLEDFFQEDKLGQPMIMISHLQSIGEINFFLMPYFRERNYPGRKGRLRYPFLIDRSSDYESERENKHIDYAIRYSCYIGDWDIGAYFFRGTCREPILILDDLEKRLNARYEIIRQIGIDLQFTDDNCLYKCEGIIREGAESPFGAMVAGIEYTFNQIMKSSADLGLIIEYNIDNRDKKNDPTTIYNNDLFLGIRTTLNDFQDTSFLAGGLYDLESGSTLIKVEVESRIVKSLVLKAQSGIFLNIDKMDPLEAFKKDDFINISLQYHF